MENLYNKASLVLTPQMVETGKVYSMKPEDRKGDFTFSRSTYATRVGPTGLIEKETQNTAEHSNNFSQWSNKTNASLTSGQFGYDGSSDAWLLQATAATFSYIYDIPTINTGIRTRSVYAKAGTHSTMTFLWASFNQSHFATFDLSNGTFTNANCLADIEDVGNGWYRCISTITDASNTYAVLISLSDETGSAATIGDNIYIQDFQQEAGLVARDYIETTTTAIYGGITDNVPRLDYTDSSCPALLLEPQRTNLLAYSEYYAAGPWANTDVNLTTNYALSPEGKMNASLWEFTTTNTSARIQYVLGGVTAGTTYTQSYYIKSLSGDLTLRIGTSGGAVGEYEDITATSEWKRFDFTSVASATTEYPRIQNISGTQGAQILVYGAQMEQGSYATSYIPTYGSAVTRNQENTSDLTNLSANGLLNNYTSTVFIHIKNNIGRSGLTRFLTLYSSTGNNPRILFYSSNSSSQSMNLQYRVNGQSDVYQFLGVLDYTEEIKFAIVLNGNQFTSYVNGQKKETSAFVQGANLERLLLDDAGEISHFVSQLVLFPTALTDQEAIDLTTI